MEFFLAFIGFFSLIFIVYLLLKDKTNPAVAFIFVSGMAGIFLALLDTYANFGIGNTLKNFDIKYFQEKSLFDFKALKYFIGEGIKNVNTTAVLFIFSILFFGILNEAGVFNKVINVLLKTSKNSIYGICILTVISSVIVHLDGSGASSFLIVIPMLLPIYEKLGMKRTTLMTIVAISLGVMNLLPWGGPTLRAATIIGSDVNDIWFRLIPIQITGLICAFGAAILLARIEIKNGAGFNKNVNILGDLNPNLPQNTDIKFFMNILLLVAVVTLLVVNIFPSYFPFMLGLCFALFINYPQVDIAQNLINKYAKGAIMMATTLFGAGILIGVFDKSGIMKVMASVVLNIMPEWGLTLIPLIVGITAVPMALIFCTDSYFFGIMPIVVGITSAFGIDPMSIAIIMVVARNCGAFISPVVPATLLGVGLGGVSIKEHINKSFFLVWGISIICLFVGSMLGIIKFF